MVVHPPQPRAPDRLPTTAHPAPSATRRHTEHALLLLLRRGEGLAPSARLPAARVPCHDHDPFIETKHTKTSRCVPTAAIELCPRQLLPSDACCSGSADCPPCLGTRAARPTTTTTVRPDTVWRSSCPQPPACYSLARACCRPPRPRAARQAAVQLIQRMPPNRQPLSAWSLSALLEPLSAWSSNTDGSHWWVPATFPFWCPAPAPTQQPQLSRPPPQPSALGWRQHGDHVVSAAALQCTQLALTWRITASVAPRVARSMQQLAPKQPPLPFVSHAVGRPTCHYTVLMCLSRPAVDVWSVVARAHQLTGGQRPAHASAVRLRTWSVGAPRHRGQDPCPISGPLVARQLARSQQRAITAAGQDCVRASASSATFLGHHLPPSPRVALLPTVVS